MTTPCVLPPHDPPPDDVVRRPGILKRPGHRGTPSGRGVTWPEDHDAYDIVDGSPAPPLSESGQQERCEWLEEREQFDRRPRPQLSQRLEQPEASPPQPRAYKTKLQARGIPLPPPTRKARPKLHIWTPCSSPQVDYICSQLKHLHISQQGREYFKASRMMWNG